MIVTDETYPDQPVALAIAGFDPSGGAGVIADVRTFVHFGCRPAAAITSLTFQNSAGVFGAIHETALSLRAQILPIIEEQRIAALKIGMLPTAELMFEVARLIRDHKLPAPVIDQVIQSSSGYELMEQEAMQVLLGELMPLARLLTPNIPEAEELTGLTITNEDEARAAANRLCDMGARAVLVKGGHQREQRSEVRGQESERGSSPTVREGSDQAVDVLDDEGRVTIFRGDWIDAQPVRGTGCMLASAIAACLAQGVSLEESVRLAKEFVVDAIRYAPKLGSDPVTLE
jgi:hydroxymethylpyrimidine/phosphomethylpyrimidine kinase